MIQLQMRRLPPARGRGQPAASPRPPLAHAVVLAAAEGIAIAAFAAAAADATTYALADLLPPIPPLIPAAHAAVSATSVGHETTTIVEFANSGPDTVRAFRMWLSGEAAFKSFKTEKGWTGTRLPQGVLVFTAAAGGAGVEPGQAVKFGIKTDTESPAVNWRNTLL